MSNRGGAVVDPNPVANLEYREVIKDFHELGTTALDPRHSKGVVLPNQTISVGFTVDGEIAVRQLFPIQTLASIYYVRAVLNEKREGVEDVRCAPH